MIMTDQDRRGFFVLPQNPEESGYYTYGTPSDGAGQYAHPVMLNFLFWLEFHWSATEDRKFGIGNISLANGTRFAPHRSHRSGLEVDIRPLRKDGAHAPVSYKSEGYDQAATKRLISLIISSGMASKVMFNDPHISGVKPLSGHDDHIHVEVRL
jgi:penicillin-insensitive murein endopeptidase